MEAFVWCGVTGVKLLRCLDTMAIVRQTILFVTIRHCHDLLFFVKSTFLLSYELPFMFVIIKYMCGREDNISLESC